MDPQEMKDRLKNVINALIRDDSETAASELHDVLVAKTRDRINPEDPATTVDEPNDDETVVSASDDDLADDPTSTDEPA